MKEQLEVLLRQGDRVTVAEERNKPQTHRGGSVMEMSGAADMQLSDFLTSERVLNEI